VIIDGGHNGTTVTISWPGQATIKGFTVTGGLSPTSGGGIRCYGGHATIVKNRVYGNTTYVSAPPPYYGGGGGIYFTGTQGSGVVITGNLIEDNEATYACGGGICVHNQLCDYVQVDGNYIRLNTAHRGGGMAAKTDMVLGPPPSPALIASNVITSNSLTLLAPSLGGGIYCINAGFKLRHNQVTDNNGNGIYADADGGGVQAPPDIGTATDPGYNVLRRNGSHDVVDATYSGQPLSVVGNYWGTVNTATVASRIEIHSPPIPQYDPIAASSRWFDVDEVGGSTCATSVLVTGDLRVSRSLTVSPGKSFEFYPVPDTSLPGGDANLTDLLVQGSGTVLTSYGTSEDSIRYHSKHFFGDPEVAGDWYGIRVQNGAEALFYYSLIRSAYCGIDVASNATAHANRSKLTGCLFAGAYGQQGMLCVENSDVSFNEAYGVRYEMPGPNHDCYVLYSTLNHNGYVGVSFEGASASLAPHRISDNQLVGGWSSPLALNGIEVLDGGDWVSVEDNDVSDFSQTGIAITASAPSFGGNNVHDNHVDGIAFYEGSNPDANNNSVTDNGLDGIACYASSPSVRQNTMTSNAGAGIVCIDGSNPYVRSNDIGDHQYGVYSDATSCPDLGTEEDPGNNWIDDDNTIWVPQDSAAQNGIEAILNYWGVSDPSQYPQKFIGYIDYTPWLTSPPQRGGQQSAGSVALRLVTGLDRVSPMPMRSTARIPFQVARSGQVALSIADASGRLVRTLMRGERGAGRYNVTWDRHDDRGRSVSAGVYFCTLTVDNQRFRRKVVLAD
jgi:parallel beta-helix repeat protein